MAVRVLHDDCFTDVVQADTWISRSSGVLEVYDAEDSLVAEFPPRTWRGVVRLHEVKP